MTDLRYRNCPKCTYYVTYHMIKCPRCHFKLRPEIRSPNEHETNPKTPIVPPNFKESVIKNVLTYHYFEFQKQNENQNNKRSSNQKEKKSDKKKKGKVCKNCFKDNSGQNSGICIYCGYHI